jgi:hypothetical protein
MNRSPVRIVNVNREFTFTEIINKAFRIGVSPGALMQKLHASPYPRQPQENDRCALAS